MFLVRTRSQESWFFLTVGDPSYYLCINGSSPVEKENVKSQGRERMPGEQSPGKCDLDMHRQAWEGGPGVMWHGLHGGMGWPLMASQLPL